MADDETTLRLKVRVGRSKEKCSVMNRDRCTQERMAANDAPLPLGYTSAWLALGVVSPSDIARDEREYFMGNELSPEHYRWRAFSRFLAAQESLSPHLAQQLYALGSADPDSSMGGSMMAAILRREDCPAELLHTALASHRPYLQRIATERLI